MLSYNTLILALVSALIILWSSSISSAIAAEWILLGTDPDDGFEIDLFEIYTQIDGEFLRLKVSSYNDWGNPAKDMYVTVHINSDLNSRTGDPEDEGADYIIHVGSYKDSFAAELWKFKERPDPGFYRDDAPLHDVVLKADSNVCQFAVKLADIAASEDAIDLWVGMRDLKADTFDYAPDDEWFYRLQIDDPPEIKINPDSVNVELNTDEVATEGVTLKNEGSGELKYDIKVEFGNPNLKANRAFKMPVHSINKLEQMMQALEQHIPADIRQANVVAAQGDETWTLMGTDTDEDPRHANIHSVFARHDADKIDFKITSHRNWGQDFTVMLLIDADRNPNTGDLLGIDYIASVLLEGFPMDALFEYDENEDPDFPFTLVGFLTDVLMKPNSDEAQLGVRWRDIGNPQEFDFFVIGREPNTDIDLAPDVGFYTYPPPPSIPTLNWLSVEPNAGTIDGGKSQELTLTLDAGELEQGEYSASIQISSNDPNQSAVTLPVQMKVGDSEKVTKVEVIPPEQPIKVGQTAEVKITVDTKENISGYQLRLIYGSNILKFKDAEEGKFLKSDGEQSFWNQPITDDKAGTILLSAARKTKGGVSGKGEIAILTFEAIAAGTSPVEFQPEATLFVSPEGEPISAAEMVSNVVIVASLGDVNGDLAVNIIDLVLVGQNLGRQVEDGQQPEWNEVGDDSLPDRADANDDGKVDVSDMLLVAQQFDENKPAAAPSALISSSAALKVGRIRQLSDGSLQADIELVAETPIAGFQFDLSFENKAIKTISVSKGSSLSQGNTLTYWRAPQIHHERGEIVGIAAVRLGGKGGIQAKSVIASVRFRVSEEQLTPIRFDVMNARLVDDSGKVIIPTVGGKSFSVEEFITHERNSLLPNYPNPFNPETWVPYKLAESATVTIQIYNSLGQLVRTLNLGYRGKGAYLSKERAAYWDGKNDAGEQVASGVYFYTLKAGAFSATRKTIVVR